MASGPNPQTAAGSDGARVVGPEWMAENMPDMLPGWTPDVDGEEEGATGKGEKARGLMYKGKWLISPERQERTVRLFWVSGELLLAKQEMLAIGHHGLTGQLQRILLKNAYMPMVFRLTVLAFSIAGLAVAANIYRNIKNVNRDADPGNQCATRASTYMAISVGSVAVPYICYVTWDEYMSKPYVLSRTSNLPLPLSANAFKSRPPLRRSQNPPPPLRPLLHLLRVLEPLACARRPLRPPLGLLRRAPADYRQ